MNFFDRKRRNDQLDLFVAYGDDDVGQLAHVVECVVFRVFEIERDLTACGILRYGVVGHGEIGTVENDGRPFEAVVVAHVEFAVVVARRVVGQDDRLDRRLAVLERHGLVRADGAAQVAVAQNVLDQFADGADRRGNVVALRDGQVFPVEFAVAVAQRENQTAHVGLRRFADGDLDRTVAVVDALGDLVAGDFEIHPLLLGLFVLVGDRPLTVAPHRNGRVFGSRSGEGDGLLR